MFRLYEFFIGLRYLKSKKTQGFISFNTFLSVLIVWIGVFILILVISVMNGFQAQIKDKILDFDAHITISNAYGSRDGSAIRNYQSIVEKVKDVPNVSSLSPFIQGQALFRFMTRINYVMVRGIGDKDNIPQEVVRFITRGADSFAVERGVYIGEELAYSYNINIGQVIELIVPKGRLMAREGVVPGIGRFKVLGFFKTGYYEFDTKLVVMSLPEAQRLFEVGNVAWGIGVKVKDVYKDLDHVSSEIRNRIGFDYTTMTAEEKNQNLFYALKLEKLIMTIILFLVIISAGFTIMGTIVMVVMEKKKSIGILKSMGASPNSIMVIFVLEGFLIGVIGTLIGVLTGLAASLNLEAIIYRIEEIINMAGAKIYDIFNLGIFYNISLVPKHVYYIDTIPTEVSANFIVFIAIFAVFLSTIAATFPAWHASRQNPVDTIRYE
ncbi:MAG: ABC transporter permease [Leptospirales bacterium]|nr:ABC transporter permease [Leptospirales bacterium]